METKTPVVRQTNWLMVIPQLLVLLILVVIFWFLFEPQLGILSVLVGAFVFLFYSNISRRLLLRHHNQGRVFTEMGQYEQAIAEFERSYSFFRQYPWIDYYRYLTMMIPAQQSYREMALINIAYCFGQVGNKAKTIEFYERTLQEFPDSVMAKTALKFIEAMEQNDD